MKAENGFLTTKMLANMIVEWKTVELTVETLVRKLESLGIIVNVDRLMAQWKKHIVNPVVNGLKGSINVQNVGG